MSERLRGSYDDALYKLTYTLLYFTASLDRPRLLEASFRCRTETAISAWRASKLSLSPVSSLFFCMDYCCQYALFIRRNASRSCCKSIPSVWTAIIMTSKNINPASANA